MTEKALAKPLACRRGTGILPVFMGVSGTGILPVFMGGTPMPREAYKNIVKVAGETRI
jgi:hypothetical protein